MNQINPLRQTVIMAERALGLRLTVHNRTGIIKHPDGTNLLERSRGLHEHPLCIRCKNAAIASCLRDCQDRANARSMELKVPWVHTCWAGLTELVVPAVKNNTYFFTVFAGVFRVFGQNLPSGSPVPRKAFTALPEIDDDEMERMKAFISTLNLGMLGYVEDLHRFHDGGGRMELVRRFLYFRSREKVSLKDLAAYLKLSNDRASHVVTELFGVPFRKLLLHERLKNARAVLLAQADLNAGDVAGSVGINDEYFFNRAFRERYGLPPGRYRKEHLKKTP